MITRSDEIGAWPVALGAVAGVDWPPDPVAVCNHIAALRWTVGMLATGVSPEYSVGAGEMFRIIGEQWGEDARKEIAGLVGALGDRINRLKTL